MQRVYRLNLSKTNWLKIQRLIFFNLLREKDTGDEGGRRTHHAEGRGSNARLSRCLASQPPHAIGRGGGGRRRLGFHSVQAHFIRLWFSSGTCSVPAAAVHEAKSSIMALLLACRVKVVVVDREHSGREHALSGSFQSNDDNNGLLLY